MVEYHIFKIDEENDELNNPLDMGIGNCTLIKLTEQEFQHLFTGLLLSTKLYSLVDNERQEKWKDLNQVDKVVINKLKELL